VAVSPGSLPAVLVPELESLAVVWVPLVLEQATANARSSIPEIFLNNSVLLCRSAAAKSRHWRRSAKGPTCLVTHITLRQIACRACDGFFGMERPAA
jgi:hypothetical protein